MHTNPNIPIYDNDNLFFIAPLYDIGKGFYNGIRNFESHLTINSKQKYQIQ